MKRLILMLFATLFLFSACNNEKKAEEKTSAEISADSTTADSPKDKVWIPIDSAKAMQAMMEAGNLVKNTKCWPNQMVHGQRI